MIYIVKTKKPSWKTFCKKTLGMHEGIDIFAAKKKKKKAKKKAVTIIVEDYFLF